MKHLVTNNYLCPLDNSNHFFRVDRMVTNVSSESKVALSQKFFTNCFQVLLLFPPSPVLTSLEISMEL